VLGELAAVLSALLLSVNGRYVVAILAICVALRWWDGRRESGVKLRAGEAP
jgi:hypothetical protein